MPNLLHLTTAPTTAGELLTGYGAGALFRIERGSAQAGPFAEVATVAIVSGQEEYDTWDGTGTSAHWYRVRFSNAGGTTTSDYGAAFQPGAQLICSLADVTQRIKGTVSDEDERLLLKFIRALTTGIQGYTGRQFIPDLVDRTIRLHTRAGRLLRIPKGIQSLTSLGVASNSQPASGGTYTAATMTDVYLDPPEYDRDAGWPATSVVIRDNASGAVTTFSDAAHGAELVGKMGFPAIPDDIGIIAEAAVIRYWQARGSGVATALGSEDFAGRILRWLSPEDRDTLDWYSVRKVA